MSLPCSLLSHWLGVDPRKTGLNVNGVIEFTTQYLDHLSITFPTIGDLRGTFSRPLQNPRHVVLEKTQALWKPLGHFQLKTSKKSTQFKNRLFKNVGFIIIQVWQIQKSGDSCHWKDDLLCMLTVSKRRVLPHRRAHMGKHQHWSEGRGNERKMWARGLIVVSVGRNGQDGVGRFRIG